MRRIEQTFDEETLFVEIGLAHLRDEEDLAARVREVAEGRAPGVRKALAAAAGGVAESLRMPKTADLIGTALRTEKIERLALVMDEVQTVGPTEKPGLLLLHTRGLGVPAVCLFAGLSHTAGVIGSLGGLSRLSRNAVANVDRLPHEACAESTRAMLEAFGATGDVVRAAETVAGLSFGWPQHLKCAQQALCRELLRTDGDLARSDPERVRLESDESRFDYYRARMSGSVLDLYRAFTAEVVLETARRGVSEPGPLVALCDEALAARREAFPGLASADGEGFAAALVERGVLSRKDRSFAAAIPSMADWLGEELARYRAERIPARYGFER